MKKLRHNQDGSALIFVIACISILSVFGSMLLVKTTNNRDMKEREKKAQAAFYAAESGSMEFASALETLCQDAVKTAFSDLMVEYTKLSTDTERSERFASVFQKILLDKLQKDNGAKELLENALGATSPVTVSMNPSDVTTITSTEVTKKTDTIVLKNVKFSFKDSSGNNTTITTDIKVDALIPDVKKGMVAGACAEFYDFALICGGNAFSLSGSNNVQKVNGNVFIEKDLTVNQNSDNVSFLNADKFLVKGGINIDHAKVKFDNTGISGIGKGIWAGNISIGESGNLNAKNCNVYVADDLTISGDKPTVEISGFEYVGYSGGMYNTADKNSAITINYAKDVKLDLSNLDNLVLRGSSYIEDKEWGNVAGAGEENKLGILQGESIAYKDMQAMYLVPSECTPQGQNPMLKAEFTELATEDIQAILDYDISSSYDGYSFVLRNYLNEDKPYVKRYVILDGGATEFVYLYLNFNNANAAKAYYQDYMKTYRGARIKEQIKNLNSATGKSSVKLAKANFTLSNMIQYYEQADGSMALQTIAPESSGIMTMNSKSKTAAQNFSGLFSFFRLDKVTVIPEGYEIIKEAVLADDISTVLGGSSSFSKTVGSYKFLVIDGNAETSDSSISAMNNKQGIILVDGDLTFNTGFNFEGMILTTGDVKMNAYDIKANKDIVLAMLDDDDVAKFFKGHGAGGASTNGSYVSTESIDISFDNWNRN